MRAKLGVLKKKGRRKRFKCFVLRRERKPTKNGDYKDLVLLTDVRRRSGELLTDHLRVEEGYWSRDVLDHDIICIEARIYEYVRACGRADFSLKDLWLVKNYTEAEEWEAEEAAAQSA